MLPCMLERPPPPPSPSPPPPPLTPSPLPLPAAAAALAITTRFADLGLDADLQRAAAAAGWLQPTDIQCAAFGATLAGRDVLALAPTGAGKTAAFLLPIFQRWLANPAVTQDHPRRLRAVVLVPTRELAAQIAAAAQALAPQFKTVVAVGGLSINPQLMALRGSAHLVVATPGRLLDLSRHNALRLNDLETVVLDEADRLLDDGFADETRRVLALMPRPRQTLLFSATWPDTLLQLAGAVQTDALRVEVAAQMHGPATMAQAPAAVAVQGDPGTATQSDAVTNVLGDLLTKAPHIVQRVFVVDSARRTTLLRHLISSLKWRKVLVFVATQHSAERVADKLRQAGLPAAALHGDLSPGRRAQVLDDLASGALQVLVATDLASRGLDVPDIDAVVNHDLPRSPVDHIHRIGRTARAGAAGLAVSLVLADAPGSEAHFRLIEKRQQLRVPREQVPGFEPAGGVLPLLPADTGGGIKGRRPSKKDKLRAAALRS